MKSTKMAESLVRDLSDKLSVRFSGGAGINTVRNAKDSNGWPMLFLSTNGVETASNPVIGLRISAVDAVSKDIFGNQTFSYTPHVLEIAYELTGANNPIPIDTDILTAEFEAIKTGVKIQLKELPNTTAVTAANMDSATVSIELDDLYWPTKGI